MPYKDPERQRQNRKRYRLKNKERLKQYFKKYGEENQDKLVKKKKKYYGFLIKLVYWVH